MWSQNWGEMMWGVGVPVPMLWPLGLIVLGILLVGCSTYVLHRRQSALAATLFAICVVVPMSAYAGSVTLSHTFVNGTIADADQVNENFQDLATEVNDNDSRISNNESRVSVFGTNTSFANAGFGDGCTLGEVWLTAGSVASGRPAAGQLINISQNPSLFSLLGTTYGGDGESTFALPDLRNAAPNGLTYVICENGWFPSTS